MSTLHISFLGLTPRTHLLVLVRSNGSIHTSELETRSLLLHDFVHLAIEEEAALRHGFWGQVADGAAPADLRLSDDAHPDLVAAETLVGPMQAVWHQRLAAEAYVQAMRPKHSFVDAGFVQRVLERIRGLDGQWRGTRFGEPMEVVYRTP